MLTTQTPNLYIIHHPEKGRCVYCSDDIPKGSLIEICMLIILSAKDTKTIHNTQLHDFYFNWEVEEGQSAIALGFGSLYNHSYTPNASVESLLDTQEILIESMLDIPAGTEITINYQGTSKDEKQAIWFDVLH